MTPVGSVAEIEQAYRIGLAHETTLSDDDRRAGAHYTPVDVAEGLVARALDLLDPSSSRTCGGIRRETTDSSASSWVPRCWDPSSGGGVFLVALAEALWRRGIDARTVVEQCVVGVDLDSGAVDAGRAALVSWASARGVDRVEPDVRVADGLRSDLGTFDLIVGNPPFRNQLGRATARDVATSAQRRDRFGHAATGYVDDAVLFLLEAARSLRPGGVACLIQPRSVLSAQHAAEARAAVQSDGRHVVAAWLPSEQVFDATVEVWAPFVRNGSPPTQIDVVSGRRADQVAGSVPPVSGSGWASIAAVADGVPDISNLRVEGTLGDLATATAGFRDEYYGVLAHTVEERPIGRSMRVVTTGLIDPGVCRWGVTAARFGKRSWDHPWLDLDALAGDQPRIARWVERLSVPKVLVASQTRVVEAVADRDGDMVPVTPTVALVPADPADLDLIVAALLSPPVAAWCQRRSAGSGMSAAAVRMTAKDLLEVPLPLDRRRWTDATGALGRGATWAEHGASMCAAYGVDDASVEWWLGALPKAVRGSAPLSD